MKKTLLLLLAFTSIFQSCIEDVELDIIGGDPKIVIEGRIDSDSIPFILITRNLSIADQLDTSKLFVKNAKVYV
jgi:hypothetical protein